MQIITLPSTNEPIKIPEKPFICPIGPKAFKSSSMLKAHKLWHSSHDERSRKSANSPMEIKISGENEPTKHEEDQVQTLEVKRTPILFRQVKAISNLPL